MFSLFIFFQMKWPPTPAVPAPVAAAPAAAAPVVGCSGDASSSSTTSASWNAKKLEMRGVREMTNKNFPGAYVQYPQQTNSFDCGAYVLQYVECFLEVCIY